MAKNTDTTEDLKYGIPALAEALGTEPHLVRARLRTAKVAKAGKKYGWATKADFDAVVKQLKAEPAEKPAKAAKPAKAEKATPAKAPAKTAKAKKAA
jgi:hypothetical protein